MELIRGCLYEQYSQLSPEAEPIEDLTDPIMHTARLFG